MTPARVTTLVLGSALLTTWLVSAAVTRQGTDLRPEGAAAPPPQAAPAHDDLQIQAERLQARLDAAPAPRRSPRNPFRFAAPVERATPLPEPREAVGTLPAADPTPQSPPPPSLRLVGIAAVDSTAGAVRTAAISVAGVLALVRPGDDVAGRYRVAAISADVVELTDRLGGPPLRLALR